ncbi:winged helix-turn-helix transcriptional regulator [Pendulispora albinea]|uniref:Helix-turn-helix transcriptional regulator n=1 Tax=Pendulispora albinea TaxID=2741071 RepID=A0ABZ2M1U9_9BACT
MARAPTKRALPGHPVRGSRTGRPIMAALDLLGRRWTLRVLWELRAGPATFRELRERCDDVSPTVLNARLKELREAGVVEHASESEEAGYRTTDAGSALLRALAPLNQWAEAWARGLP